MTRTAPDPRTTFDSNVPFTRARPRGSRLRGRAVVLCLAPLLGGCGARSALETPLDEGCPTDAADLQVPSTTAWFDTGVDVIASQRLQITATGEVRYGDEDQQVTDANGGHYSGEKFFDTAVLPTAVVVSLIGKIGGTTAVDTGAPVPEGAPGDGPGFVGASYDELAVDTGRLFLGFNDQKQAFGDNSGAFTVSITVSCDP